MKHSSKRRVSRWLGKRGVFGSTTTELILFLFIGAVMIGYAVPNFKDFVINNRTVSGTNLVVSAPNYARSEAIKRGMPVTACASSDYANCSASIWHEGWMVFSDEPIAGVADGPDEVLRTQDGVELDITLVSGQSFIRFAPNGALADVGHDFEEVEGFAAYPYEPSPIGTLMANLLPISSAYADDDSSGGGGGGQKAGGGGQTFVPNPAAAYTFKVCPKVAGYKGRAIEVAPNGQIRTTEVACS